MRITDADLDYWGDVFVSHGYRQYMTFMQFLGNPEGFHQRLQFYRSHGVEPKVLLNNAIARLQRDMDALAQRNGHPFERLTHRRKPNH